MQRNTLKKATVLVLDGDMPHAVTIVRSLARAGFAVKVAAHGEKPIASYSRWAKETLSYPDPLEQQGSFVGWARELLQRREFELVIPVTERTMVPLARDPDISVCTNVIAMPDRESLEVVLDKDRTFELAGKLDIAYPSSLTVRSVQEAESVAGQLGYPVVLKPARSVGAANGQRVQLKVEYAHSPEEYRSRIGELLRFGPVILQEYFSGEGVGVELIANRGIVKYTFQHRRLHELPLTGGGSTLRESVEVNRELEAASTALIKALNWHGVAMVEFKYNPDSGEYRLMEINGRFWGSLPLAVSAGADFPAMLAELHLDGSIRERPPARVGVRCRRLQTDLQWYEAVLRAYGGSRLVTLPGRWQLIKDALMVFSPRHGFDLQSFKDPMPGLVEIQQCLQSYWRRVASQLIQRRLLSQQASAWKSGRVYAQLARSKNVLFLCYGNINRSPLAQAYFEKHGCTGQQVVTSAGFHPVTERPADPNMISVAASHGIDLARSESKQVNRRMLEEADIVFVMELKHLLKISEDYPEFVSKCFMLGCAITDTNSLRDIADPYGKPKSEYDRCYTQIAFSIKSLKI